MFSFNLKSKVLFLEVASTSDSKITTGELNYFEESTTVTSATTESAFITMSTEITSTLSNNASKSLYVSIIAFVFLVFLYL